MLNAVFGLGLGLLSGWMVTRTTRRDVLLSVGTFALAGLLAAAAMTSNLLVFVLIISLVTGLSVFITATETAMEPHLLPDERAIITANSLRGSVLQSFQIIAPLLAGILLTLSTVTSLLLMTAVVALLPAILFLSTGANGYDRSENKSSSLGFLNSLLAARRDIADNADLRIFFAVEILAIFLLGMQGPLIFTYFVEERGFAAHNFPYLMVSLGTGAIIGALPLLRGNLRLTMKMILLLMIIDGVGLFCFVVTPWASFLFVFMTVMGLINGVFFTTMRSFLQAQPEIAQRNRLISIFYGIQEPFIMVGLISIFLLSPIASAADILGAAALLEIALCAVFLTRLRGSKVVS